MTKRIPILYGTETGNAEYCAETLSEALEEVGVAAEPVDMGNYEAENILLEKLVIIVTSTYGNGDPPANAQKVLAFVQKPDVSLSELKFAVCALGDKSYPYFAQCGKDFDAALGDRGGQRLLDRIDCDEDFDDDFATFTTQLTEYFEANPDLAASFPA